MHRKPNKNAPRLPIRLNSNATAHDTAATVSTDASMGTAFGCLTVDTDEHYPMVRRNMSSCTSMDSIPGTTANSGSPISSTQQHQHQHRVLHSNVMTHVSAMHSGEGLALSRTMSNLSDAMTSDAASSVVLEDSRPSPQPQQATFLGQGAQGAVFKQVAEDGRTYAVKRISFASTDDQASLVRELNTAERLGLDPSEYLVQVQFVSYVDDSGCVLLYMELERYNTRQLLEQMASEHRQLSVRGGFMPYDPMPTVDAVVLRLFAHDVLQGLRHLHDTLQRCHNDVKPENVLVRADGRGFKLADFGCAVQLSQHGGTVDVLSLGSSSFRAPERSEATRVRVGAHVPLFGSSKQQGDGRRLECTSKTDMWAFGAVMVDLRGAAAQLFDAAAQQPLSTAGQVQAKLFKQQRRGYWSQRAKALVGMLPAGCPMHGMVVKCVHPDPTKRHEARDVLADVWMPQGDDELERLRNQFEAVTATIATGSHSPASHRSPTGTVSEFMRRLFERAASKVIKGGAQHVCATRTGSGSGPVQHRPRAKTHLEASLSIPDVAPVYESPTTSVPPYSHPREGTSCQIRHKGDRRYGRSSKAPQGRSQRSRGS